MAVGVEAGVEAEVEMGMGMASLVLHVWELGLPHAVWGPKLNVPLDRHQ